MALISFSERDLKRGTLVEPAWYRMKIDEIGEEHSKDKKSVNYPVEGTIICNAENGDKQFEGIPISWNFNSKALGFVKGFFLAQDIELAADKRYDLNASAGCVIDVYIENEMYDNRPVNRINHKYRKSQQ